jgi:hypothetical protein
MLAVEIRDSSEIALVSTNHVTRGCDADRIGELARLTRRVSQYSAETQSQTLICFSVFLYRGCNLIERFFNRSRSVGVSLFD